MRATPCGNSLLSKRGGDPLHQCPGTKPESPEESYERAEVCQGSIGRATAVPICFCTAILALFVCCSAHGQASAGCGQCGPSTGGTSNGSSGSATLANAARNKAAAEKIKAIQDNLQKNVQTINNAGSEILNVVNSARGNNGGDSNNPPSVGAANGLIESPDPDSPQPEPEPGSPEAAPSTSAAVNAILDSDSPSSPSTAAAVSALLGDGAQPGCAQPGTSGTTTANAVANLLDPSKVSDSASAFALPAPADPQINSAFEESADQPDQHQGSSPLQVLQSAGQQVVDKLSGLVSSGKSLLSDLSSDPTVYWALNQGWNGTTVPLPTASNTPEMPASSPETAANLVQGQAIVGFGDILNGVAQGPAGPAKGVYTYGSKMVNQMGAMLGFANSNIFNADSNGSN